VESDVTEFSPELRGIQEAAKHLLASTRRYRKDRHWALTSEDAKPLPEGWASSDDEAGVRAWYASKMGREWPETMEWPEESERGEEECPPLSARRILEYLASGAHGALTYRIWMSSSGDGQRQRLRRPRVLPRGNPALLLTVFQQAPDDLAPPLLEQRDMTQRLQEVERRIAHLNRLESRAMFDTGQWEDAAAYRQERRVLWQELQTLQAALPPAEGLQDKAACQAVTMTVGLDEMLPQEQRRWQKKLGHSPRTTWLVTFREYLCRLPQMGRNPIYIDVHTTTEDDITVQVLAYLLQAEMVLWEDIEPWVKHYAAAGGQETVGKPWDTYLRRTWCQEMLEFALPQEANALRPALPAQREPEEYSIPQAAKVLGITERQLRYKIEHEEILGVEKLGRRVRILPEALEHLQRQVMDQARRQQDKTRRAMFSAQAQQVSMKPPAIRQMIHRGPQTPEGAPDWDALEAQLKRKTAAQGGDSQRPSLSEDVMRKLIAHLDRGLAQAETKQEHDTLWEQRLSLQQWLGGSPL
jgi:hypothetical protein